MLERARQVLAGWLLPKTYGSDSPRGPVLTMTNRGEAPRRGSAELLDAYRTSPWLRAVTSRIAMSVAAVPWKLYAVKRGGKPVRSKALQFGDLATRTKLMAQAKAKGELVELEDHPMLDLLENANPLMTGLRARQLTQLHLDIKGESYWVIERNGLGKPAEFWPVPPSWVMKTPSLEEPYYQVQFRGARVNVPAGDVFCMKEPDPANPYGRGVGIGESLADEIGTDEFASKYVNAFFYNRAKPDLIIGVEGLSKADAEAAKAKFEQENRGFRKAHRTHWLGGKFTIQQLDQTFHDIQMTELRSWERDCFISVYGIPPEKVGVLQNSNRATIDASTYIYASDVLVPRLEVTRTEYQARLAPEFDDRIIVGYVSPVPDDKEFQLKALQAASHTATVGEWRALQGLSDRGEQDDVHMVPYTLMPVRPSELGDDDEPVPPAGEPTKRRSLRRRQRP